MNLLENINGYDKAQWQAEFSKTELYQQLLQDYDILMFDKNSEVVSAMTPRQNWGDRNKQTFFSATIFYYLEKLFELDHKTVYDIGCGWNIFKKYYPNIVGIGAEQPGTETYYADIHDYVDKIYVDGHQEFFDCFFSINALHFRPLNEIGLLVDELVSMLKPNGTSFVTFNSDMFVKFETEENKIKLFGTPKPKSSQVELYIREQLATADVQWNIVDIDLSVSADGLDGNVRLMFTRTN